MVHLSFSSRIRWFLAGFAVAAWASVLALGQTPTNTTGPSFKKAEGKEFTVVGISVRTNNAKEMGGNGEIPKQWQRFMGEGMFNKVTDRADSSIMAVYTDFVVGSGSASDIEFTFTIGVKVNSDADIPSGMVAKKVPAGTYAVFTSEKGPAPQVVPAIWQKIWSIPKSQLDRAFKTDYELYDQNNMDPDNLQAEVHIGIK